MARWSSEKNEILKKTRGISFEEIVEAAVSETLADYEHPNKDKYPNQRVAIVRCKGYIYQIPYVLEPNGEKFLKTIIPSRIALKKYGGEHGKENPDF